MTGGRAKRGRPVRVHTTTAPTLKAQGSPAGPLRTPLNFADPDAGKAEYEVDEILAHILKKGEDYFKVRWVGLDERGDTTEPAEHLRDEASKAKVQEFLEARAAAEPPARVAKLAQVRSGESTADDDYSTEDTIALQDGGSATRHQSIKHAKTSPVWRFCSAKFLDTDGRPATICSLCQELLATPNTTNIWNHLVRRHSSVLVEALLEAIR